MLERTDGPIPVLELVVWNNPLARKDPVPGSVARKPGDWIYLYQRLLFSAVTVRRESTQVLISALNFFRALFARPCPDVPSLFGLTVSS